MSTNPAISVIMPAYNASGYIERSIKSILDQTYKDFELIVINDGSTDETSKILSSIKDKRLRVVNQSNKGIVSALNRGIELSEAPLIARQDADDISEPTRLEKQVNLLGQHNKVVLVGSSMAVMNMDGVRLHTHYLLLNSSELKQELLIRSPFAHGSVMFNKEIFMKAGRYQKKDWPAEDYGLWVRMSSYGEFANINEPLYVYRENSDGISVKNNDLQKERTHATQRRAWQVRKKLTPAKINTVDYESLEMGEDRIERIASNVIYTLKKSFVGVNIKYIFKNVLILAQSPLLLRKSIRITLIKLKLYHV